MENYDDAEIRALLEKIAVRSDIAPNEKSTITEILSGKAWRICKNSGRIVAR